MTGPRRIALIGGGVASASAALTLRADGFDGEITMLTREVDQPYHRPPITKALLAEQPGADDGTGLAVRSPSWWADHGVEVHTRANVTDIDRQRRVVLAGRLQVPYDRALIATGASVRRLVVDGANLAGIHYLRTPLNAYRLREDVARAGRVVLVGGSFIAVEVAASLTARGIACTLIMNESSCLERSCGPIVAGHVADQLRDRGVRMIGDTEVVAFTGEERVSGVRTAGGHDIPADLVVVGVGAQPDVKLARRIGLELTAGGGIACDSRLRTSDPELYAAGDVCAYDSVVHREVLRVEHESHAIAQGVTAARNLLGVETPHREIPYFWTELADWATLESVGPPTRWDEEILTGELAAGEFTVWYLRAGSLVGCLTSGRPQDLDVARELIGSGEPVGDRFADAVAAMDGARR